MICYYNTPQIMTKTISAYSSDLSIVFMMSSGSHSFFPPPAYISSFNPTLREYCKSNLQKRKQQYPLYLKTLLRIFLINLFGNFGTFRSHVIIQIFKLPIFDGLILVTNVFLFAENSSETTQDFETKLIDK